MIKYQGLSTLEALEGAKRYNKWIADQFIPQVKYPLLEIGSGTGNMSVFFMQKGTTTLSDIDEGLLAGLKKRFYKNKFLTVKKIDISKSIVKSEKNKYQSIIAVNVLEHIKDDKKALRNMNILLKKNGKLLLLVPAKKIAFTQLDKKLGHFRRYEKNEFIEELKMSGFIIDEVYFFNILGLLSWIIRDKVEKGHQIKPYQAALFDLVVPLLKAIESAVKPPIGISLIAIARKR